MRRKASRGDDILKIDNLNSIARCFPAFHARQIRQSAQSPLRNDGGEKCCERDSCSASKTQERGNRHRRDCDRQHPGNVGVNLARNDAVECEPSDNCRGAKESLSHHGGRERKRIIQSLGLEK